MNQHRVLVTGVGGNIGQGIVKSLRVSRYPFDIVGVDMEPLSAGFSLVDRYETVPQTGSREFDERFKEIAGRENLEAVYVCSPAELEYFSTHKKELEQQFGFSIFVNPPEVCRIGKDKFKTAEFLKKAGFPYPQTTLAGDKKAVARLVKECGFPLIMKPREGFTSHNVFLVKSEAQMEAASVLVPDLVVQQYLSEEKGEYTAGTLSGADKKVRAVIVLKRQVLQGTSYRTELVEDKDLLNQVVRVVEKFGAIGICNIQFRLRGKEAVVFEINPRFSGTSGVRHLYGFNDPEMMFEEFCLKQRVTQPLLRPAVVLRYWNEVSISGADFQTFEKDKRGHDGLQTIIPRPLGEDRRPRVYSNTPGVPDET